MAHILQDLLTLSRFDSGRSELRLTRFPFAQAVDDTYQAVLMDAQNHGYPSWPPSSGPATGSSMRMVSPGSALSTR